MIFVGGRDFSALLISLAVAFFFSFIVLYVGFTNTKNVRKYQYLDSLLFSFLIALIIGRTLYILFHLGNYGAIEWRFSIRSPVNEMFNFFPYKFINLWDGTELVWLLMVTMLLHVSFSKKKYQFSLRKSLYFFNRFFMCWLLLYMGILSWWNRSSMSIGFIVILVCVFLLLVSYVIYTIVNRKNRPRIRYIQISNLFLFFILAILTYIFNIEHLDFIYIFVFLIAFVVWNIFLIVEVSKIKDDSTPVDIRMKDWK
ncbi:MAG TPA: hypothetical protein PK957_00520 [Candidatus Dojkabacteria bacterium]|nr:hypothetical protein [Candidatus Dojkabacteria bacterium]HQF36097.1 hypothetical protein [Candidatus Dojkabacteria bacterium]